jgi:TPR repeat protein
MISAQLRVATLFRQARVIPRDMDLSARYFKRAADPGSAEGRFKYAVFIRNENRVPGIVHRRESEHYLRLADLFGGFDFQEALTLSQQASPSGPNSGWFRFPNR